MPNYFYDLPYELKEKINEIVIRAYMLEVGRDLKLLCKSLPVPRKRDDLQSGHAEATRNYNINKALDIWCKYATNVHQIYCIQKVYKRLASTDYRIKKWSENGYLTLCYIRQDYTYASNSSYLPMLTLLDYYTIEGSQRYGRIYKSYRTNIDNGIYTKSYLIKHLKANNQKCSSSWSNEKLLKAVMAF